MFCSRVPKAWVNHETITVSLYFSQCQMILVALNGIFSLLRICWDVKLMGFLSDRDVTLWLGLLELLARKVVSWDQAHFDSCATNLLKFAWLMTSSQEAFAQSLHSTFTLLWRVLCNPVDLSNLSYFSNLTVTSNYWLTKRYVCSHLID